MKIDHVTVQGGRDHQEDAYTLVQSDGGWLCAVFDGHNGGDVSKWLATELPRTFDKHTDIREMFHALQAGVRDSDQGSTCSMACITKTFGLTSLGIAVLGDSPIIVRTKEGIVIPALHNVRSNTAERVAVLNRGAVIVRGYAIDTKSGNGCQLSRAFGDAGMGYMDHEPFLQRLSDVQWMVLATDGILDTHELTESTAADIIKAMDNGATATDLLPSNPSDNVTIITIRE